MIVWIYVKVVICVFSGDVVGNSVCYVIICYWEWVFIVVDVFGVFFVILNCV